MFKIKVKPYLAGGRGLLVMLLVVQGSPVYGWWQQQRCTRSEEIGQRDGREGRKKTRKRHDFFLNFGLRFLHAQCIKSTFIYTRLILDSNWNNPNR